MRRVMNMVAVGTLALGLVSGAAIAQEHHDDQEHHDQYHHDQYVRHDDWRKGHHMRHEDWDRGQRIDDWQARHLRRPPRGYEWREMDGQYVMANRDGVIFQVVVPR
ncbi:MAG TPA: RcnB family protein [Acidobacteriaceae bacterium]|nr:RcnB family protein [Acidobacteriaceae bacterium]